MIKPLAIITALLATLSMSAYADDCSFPVWLSRLKLDSSQCQKFRTLERDFYNQNDELAQKKRSNSFAVQKLMNKENLDDSAISKLSSEWGDISQQQIKLTLKSVQFFKKLLTPTQHKELREQEDWIYAWYNQLSW